MPPAGSLESEASNAARADKETIMLSWAVTFFIIAIIAGILGFGGIAAGAASIAKLLFFLFLVLFLVSIIAHGVRSATRGSPPL